MVLALEDNIIIFVLSEHVLRFGTVPSSFDLLHPLLYFSICCSLVSLLLARHFLQSVEFLAIEFVEFGVDI